MIIKRNHERETVIFDLIRTSFANEKRDGIHLTDLMYPRKAYWRFKDPQPPDDKEIQYFVIGRGHEDVMHHVTGLFHIESKVWNGILYSMDFYQGHPIEHKTRRMNLAKDGEEATVYDNYLKQLIGYCACEWILIGELWVWSLVEKTDAFRTAPQFVCYDVEFTEEELEAEQERMISAKKLLLESLSDSNWEPLPLCPDWMCYSKISLMTGKPHCATCDKDFATDWGINKHINSKTGEGHEITEAVYVHTEEPRCKYYFPCRV